MGTDERDQSDKCSVSYKNLVRDARKSVDRIWPGKFMLQTLLRAFPLQTLKAGKGKGYCNATSKISPVFVVNLPGNWKLDYIITFEMDEWANSPRICNKI